MGGSGRTILETNATLEINTAFVSLNSRTVENAGTIQVSGGGSLSVTGGAVVTNRSGALFHVQNAASIGSGFANGRLDNAGTFRKSTSPGTATFDSGMSFNNSAIVEIQSGTLKLAGGGMNTGTFTTPTTAVVEWTGGTFTLNPGAQLNGDGLYRINAGTVTANTNFAVSNLDLINGTLDGTGTVTISNAMNWSGGTMSGSGRTIIPVGATLNLAISSGVGLNARTLENGGTVLWTGAGNFGMNFGSVITNRAGAVFQVQNAASLSSGGGLNRFDNAGTFRKSANAGTTTVTCTFNNLGTVEIQTGTLLCSGFFTNNGAVNLSAGTTNRLAGGGASSGTFTTPATALVEWTGGTFTLNNGAQLSGPGLYKINGISAVVVGNGDMSVQNLDLANGSSTWSGTGLLTIADTMNWMAGTMEGSGRTVIASTATLQLGSASNISLKRTLENGGNALWTGSGTMILLNGIITNRAGALFEVQNAARFFEAGGTCRFDNNGTYRKSVSTGTSTVESGMTFNNSGTVDIRSGILLANGIFISTSNALLNCALGGTTAGTNYGQLQVAGSVTLNGALNVDFINGFTPALNDTFTVVAAGTRNGAFASFSYPSNAVTMQLSNSPNSVIVRATGIAVRELVIFPPVLTGSNVMLCWAGDSNLAYRLEFTSNLGLTNWEAVAGSLITFSNKACLLDALTPSNRFYRVRVLP